MFFHFSSLDSTSCEAQRLASSQSFPFAVFADVQTSGRGRHGKSWQSPHGGLYLSIALQTDASGHQLVTLKAGVLLRRWLQRHFSLDAKLKWPNDLYFGGKKYGGILCEATAKGQNLVLVIGIGLNLQQRDLGEERTSLEQLTGQRNFDAKALGESLFEFWLEQWDGVSARQVRSEFLAAASLAGRVWQDPADGQFLYALDLGENGELGLFKPRERNYLWLNSVHHSLRAVYIYGEEGWEMPLWVLRRTDSALLYERYDHPHRRSPSWAGDRALVKRLAICAGQPLLFVEKLEALEELDARFYPLYLQGWEGYL